MSFTFSVEPFLSSDVLFLDQNWSRLVWVSRVVPEPSTVSKPTEPAGGGENQSSLSYVTSLPLLSWQLSVVIATCCQQVTTRGKRGDTSVDREGARRGICGRQDVRHVQSILARCAVVYSDCVSVCVRELVCVCGWGGMQIAQLLKEWVSFFLSGLANFLFVNEFTYLCVFAIVLCAYQRKCV